ncbi:MAG TPA: SMP-30/gluconolactonase/LRE family protein [Steroidobacteraceae bacterium]|nr:SMP-30/gluconolactonase/LRE family protein [Steroidobacteraceae bacterium]
MSSNIASAAPLALALVLAGLSSAHAQAPAEPAERPFGIVKSDPTLDSLIAPNAKLELLTDGFGLTEGPVWMPEGKSGYLLLSDLTANVIYKWTPQGVSVFLDKAGYSGTDLTNAGTQTKRGRVAVIMIGPNGEALDPQGRLVWCASPDGTIVRLEKDGSRTVLADKYEGKRFNGPNDLAIRSDGAIYFTDSDFGLRGSSKSPQKELTFNGVYLVKDGKTSLLIDDKTLGGFPNGVTLSPDEKYLYLTSSFKKMMRYELKADGTLGEGKTFFEGGEGIVDGMKTDRNGNLYSTGGAGPGAIRVSSPEGKQLGVIHLPISHKEPRQQICATNVAFGDADGKSLFITACTNLYRIRVKVAGTQAGK